MAKILILPLHAQGHMNSLIGLGRQLEEAGHQCIHLAPEQFRSYYESNGVSFLPVFNEGPQRMDDLQVLKKPETIETFRQTYFDITRDQLEELEKTIADHQPDLWLVDGLVAQYTFPALQQNIPCALIHTMLPMSNDGPPPPTTSNRPAPKLSFANLRNIASWRQLRKRTRASLAFTGEKNTYKTLANRYGIPLHALDFDNPMCFEIDIPKFILCSQALDLPRRPNPLRHYLGPTLFPNRKEVVFPWEQLNKERKLIYCSLGTMGHSKHARGFMKCMVTAVAGRDDLQLVIAEKWNITPEDLPPNVIKVDYAPQQALLREADLFVTHGGLNSIKESIAAGVPMIVFPTGNEQPGNAMRVAYHMLGLCGNQRSVTTPYLTKLFDKVLDNDLMAHNIAAMSQRFQNEMAQNLPVKMVEQLLNTKTPVFSVA